MPLPQYSEANYLCCSPSSSYLKFHIIVRLQCRVDVIVGYAWILCLYFLKWIIDSFLPPSTKKKKEKEEKQLQQKICFHTEFKSGFIGFGVEPILLLFLLLLLDKYLGNFFPFPSTYTTFHNSSSSFFFCSPANQST